MFTRLVVPLALLVLVGGSARPGAGAEPGATSGVLAPPVPGEEDVADQGATEQGAAALGNKEGILATLRETQEKYGSDVVLMEGHLLGQVVRSGSILEAEIAIPGVEERDGKRFLELRVNTGIVYNDGTLSPQARLTRLWTDLVEPTLRKFRTISAPTDGLLFRFAYTHKAYADEAELRAGLPAGRGVAASAAFYMLLVDVAALNANTLTARQFLDRVLVLVDGVEAPVAVEAPVEGK